MSRSALLAFVLAAQACGEAPVGRMSAALPIETHVWDLREKDRPIPRTIRNQFAYDEAAGVSVLFSGRSSDIVNPLNPDTWFWNGDAWTRQSPSTNPPGREAGAMAYDSVRERVVLFGGQAGSLLGDTWEWDGSNWTQRLPVQSPPARQDHALVYDRDRGVTVLFGGRNGGGSLGDTWEWNGTNWAPRTLVQNPGARADHMMAYDTQRHVTVLYGGDTGVMPLRSDTWEYNGTNWAQRSPVANPGPLSLVAMCFDRARQVAVLFTHNQTVWEWDGTLWRDRTAYPLAPAVSSTGMVYDSARARSVLYRSGTSSEAWEWDGSHWTGTQRLVPPPYRDHRMDSDRTGQMLIPPDSNGVTWLWDGADWTQKPSSPPALAGRFSYSLTYDPLRGETVLFGGSVNTGTPLGDTWIWDGTTWTEKFPTRAPILRVWQKTVFDSARGVTVLFGGTNFFADHNDVWEWNGTDWTLRFASGAPGPRYGHSMAYDAARSVTVVFGGARALDVYNETWEWNGSAWSQRTPAESPAPRLFHDMTYDPARKRVVLFGGLAMLGPPYTKFDDTWEWDGETWTRIAVPGPSARDLFAMGFDTKRRRVVLHGGGSGDLWEFHSRGSACASALDCDTGYCVDGVCCNQLSCGQCSACNLEDQAGNCEPILNGSDPDSCSAPGASCGATGLCGLAQGASCTVNADCNTGRCSSGVCCDSACDAPCDVCKASLGATADGVCTLAPAAYAGEPSCAPFACNGRFLACPTQCTSDSECGEDYSCVAGGACAALSRLGESCTQNGQCRSGFCVDGVCCDTSCGGPCERCDLPLEGSQDPNGHCIAPVGTDPDHDCGSGAGVCAGTCTAAKTCVYPGSDTPCATCAVCGGTGFCDDLPTSGDDDACGTIACASLSDECRTYLDLTRVRCETVNLCASPNNSRTCVDYVDQPDGTPCAGGACSGGTCTPLSAEKSGGCQCQFSSVADGSAGLSLLALGLLAVLRRRANRRMRGSA